MSDDLLKLAERCEAASEADGVLDSEIEIAVNGFPQKQYDARNTHYSADKLMFIQQWIGTRYTSSIDAAMTLVGEDWQVHSLGETKYINGGPWLCQLVVRGQEPPYTGPHSTAKTAALALCAAALRARWAA